ncbi:MAG: ROK family protein, partial [Porphyromonas endodontalis]
GLAGELGHFIIRRGGRPCGCGRCGCLETYCSARGMARTAIELLQESTEDSPLRHIKEEEITSKAVYDAAEAGDPIAQKVFEITGEILGESLADFMTFSSPEAIILFGGVAAAGERLLQPIQKALNKNLLCVYQTPKLLLSQLPTDDAAILGAAAVGVEAALRASGQSKGAMAS